MIIKVMLLLSLNAVLSPLANAEIVDDVTITAVVKSVDQSSVVVVTDDKTTFPLKKSEVKNGHVQTGVVNELRVSPDYYKEMFE